MVPYYLLSGSRINKYCIWRKTWYMWSSLYIVFLMPTSVYLYSLYYDNHRKNLLLCYTVQFIKCFCICYLNISIHIISFSVSDWLQWLFPCITGASLSWMKYSRCVVKNAMYSDCFCSLVSHAATLTLGHTPLPRAASSLLQSEQAG